MTSPISVSTLNIQIKNLLESTFVRVYVEGELSRITYHNSGHVYFTLKDRDASVRCVMFRGNASKLRFRLEEGLKIVVDGALSVYTPRGEYQINCFSIEPAGHGALALAFEQLKARLQQQGYFDEARKQPMPKFPKRIALVTSATGAALQDMRRVAAQRWPLAKLALYDVLVQGDQAAAAIAQALGRADASGYDVIVVGRGGGSLEDLWAFNEEIVADAVFNARTPVVSAVGHEIDWVITDFVADLRAPTPSAAMQLILPDQNEVLMQIDAMMQHFDAGLRQKCARASEQLALVRASFRRHSIEQKIAMHKEQLQTLTKRFEQAVSFRFEGHRRALEPLWQRLEQQSAAVLMQKRAALLQMQQALKAQDPALKSREGYAQISKAGRIVALESLKPGERFEAMDANTVLSARVEESRPID